MSDSFEMRLVAAQRGDEWAVASLYRELHPRVLRYLSAREPRAADDIAGEVWLAVAQGLHRFEGDELQFRGWLFSIARRRLADYRRTAVRRKTASAPAEQLDRASRSDTEVEALDRSGAQSAAAFVVSTLPADQAEVVLLRVLADLDVATVARLLGKRPGAIRVLQHRGLRRLHDVLGRKPVTR